MRESVNDTANIPGRRQGLIPDAASREKLRKKRAFKDKASRWGVTAAGFGVVFALALIFVYLFYEVMPVFKGASVKPLHQYELPVQTADLQQLVIERYQELGIQYTDDAQVTFFDLTTGEIRQQIEIPLPEQAQITSFARSEPISRMTAYGLSEGQVLVSQYGFDISFPADQRQLLPKIDYPLGKAALQIDAQGQSITHLAIESANRGGTVIAAVTADRRLLVSRLNSRLDLQTGDVIVEQQTITLDQLAQAPLKLLVDKMLRSLFVVDAQGNTIRYYDIAGLEHARFVESVSVGEGQTITAIDFLVGGVSLVVGTASGQLSQWFLVRDEANQYNLTRIRDFKPHDAAITAIAPEYTRKGFHAVDASGQLGIHYGTSARTLSLKKQSENPLTAVAVSQVNGRILFVDNQDRLTVAELWNQHPQLSFAALWNKVWYEGRSEPTYIWQSSSASDEFESKFSLVPLSVGTLKAAFYAMLFAMPLAIAGAVYTAYFMSPKIRGVVKPSIEIMEALPTVILGFLAGLWLAPFTEDHLPAIFSFLLLMPVMLLIFAFIWTKLPLSVRSRVPDGWEAALLVPVIVLFGMLCVSASPYIEIWFFDGSMRQWLTDIGITYDQRNAMIVGIAMGFAVIPTIFSIAEDAVFTVPRHLTQGALALGATRWQTMLRVVLPTASPGIFSAVMMGFGRAVGETMIVLMATGNSPIVNFNIFEGMRTLSANIAVELPETAVGSSHFRILFLAALVLLALTFIVNTLAEVIRQRLRARYSNL